MDAKEQAEGEKRVRAHLIEPLLRLGLAKPSTLTKAQFEDMCDDLCQKLAYMSATSLGALAEQCAAMAGGKGKDRIPIANKILEWAREIEPPRDDASPLIRAVFAAQLGADALDGGWAPELLGQLRAERKWPGSWTVSQVRQKASDAVRRFQDIEFRMGRGDEISAEERHWRERRLAAVRKCEDIRALALGGGQ